MILNLFSVHLSFHQFSLCFVIGLNGIHDTAPVPSVHLSFSTLNCVVFS